jgi:hypothetical protein
MRTSDTVGEIPNPKSQIPNHKAQNPNKIQNSKSKQTEAPNPGA